MPPTFTVLENAHELYTTELTKFSSWYYPVNTISEVININKQIINLQWESFDSWFYAHMVHINDLSLNRTKLSNDTTSYPFVQVSDVKLTTLAKGKSYPSKVSFKAEIFLQQ